MVSRFIRYDCLAAGHGSVFFFSFESFPNPGFNLLTIDIAHKNTKNSNRDIPPGRRHAKSLWTS
jgi:hypothetical protein